MDLHVTLLFYSVRNLILGSKIKELTLKMSFSLKVSFYSSKLLTQRFTKTTIYLPIG